MKLSLLMCFSFCVIVSTGLKATQAMYIFPLRALLYALSFSFMHSLSLSLSLPLSVLPPQSLTYAHTCTKLLHHTMLFILQQDLAWSELGAWVNLSLVGVFQFIGIWCHRCTEIRLYQEQRLIKVYLNGDKVLLVLAIY